MNRIQGSRSSGEDGSAQAVEALFHDAVRHSRAGRVAEAERLCRQAVAIDSEHADSLHLLGVIAAQTGRPRDAIDLIRRAIGLRNDAPSYHCNLGQILQGENDIAAAVAEYDRALALKPDYAEALNNVGIILKEQGKLEEAAARFVRAAMLRPGFAEAHNNLSLVYKDQGRLDEAVDECKRTLALKPNYPEAHNNLGIVLAEQNKLPEAIAEYTLAIALKPNYAEAHNNLGSALGHLGKIDAAIAHYERALALKPDYPSAHSNLALFLKDRNRCDEAITHCERALALKPEFVEAHNNLGLVLVEQGKISEAIAQFERVIALKPSHASAQWNRALTLLLSGDLKRGFESYDARFDLDSQVVFDPRLPTARKLPIPLWNGEKVAGKTLFVYAEQGAGDTIQFARFIPLLVQRGARVIFDCPADLIRLMSSLVGIVELRPRAAQWVLPRADFQIPLLSLPHRLGVRLETIVTQIPYLTVPPAITDVTVPRSAGTKLAVGVVWGGRPEHRNDHNRSMPLQHFLRLADLPSVALYSLQMGPRRRELPELGADALVHDLAPGIHDFVDTARLMQKLDLIISVDTSVVHLAGALGRPCFVLVPFAPDWRWLREGDGSPWYPTLRLFRQAVPGDWTGVMQQVHAALARMIAAT